MASGNELIRLAVFGLPVRHSLSPRIHGLFAVQAGLEVDYAAIETPAGKLSGALRDFEARGGVGCNITVPLKTEAMLLAHNCSADVKRAGAANTLTWQTNGAWRADSTDGPGLLSDLDRLGCALSGKRLAIIGAGGAAASVLGSLLAAEPASITIYNRTLARAQALREKHADLGEVIVRPLDALASEQGFDLLINATSLGHDGAMPPLHPGLLTEGGVLYDMNYGPAHAPMRRWCAEHQVACEDGLGMLVGQAAVSFGIWTGFEPDVAPVIEALSA